jgi:hypothetical protein
VQLITLDARNAAELDTALHTLSRSGADGLLVTADLMLQANKSKIAKTVREARLPAMVPYRDYLEAGTLMSYGPNIKDLMRRVAGYVDKILKGARPSDLPIEQVSNYELVIDLRAARALGINVPQALLIRRRGDTVTLFILLIAVGAHPPSSAVQLLTEIFDPPRMTGCGRSATFGRLPAVDPKETFLSRKLTFEGVARKSYEGSSYALSSSSAR